MGKRRNKSSYSRKVQEFFWKAPLSNRQQEFLTLMEEKKWVFAQGPAGCGKTLLALQVGLQQMQNGDIDKILYIRNDVRDNVFGAKPMGALPGNEFEKLCHLLGPVNDNLSELCSESKAKSLIQQEKIVPLSVEHLRGRSFTWSFIIIDECQNFNSEGVLTALTRKGKGSTMVFLGDSNQKDTQNRLSDGFKDAFDRLEGIESVGFTKFSLEDVRRDKDLIDIMKRYGY